MTYVGMKSRIEALEARAAPEHGPSIVILRPGEHQANAEQLVAQAEAREARRGRVFITIDLRTPEERLHS